MSFTISGRYGPGSIVLIITAGICAGIVSLSGRQDLISAALLVSSVILFLTGVLLLTFSRPDSIDDRFVSLLQVQGTMNTCTVAAELGLSGLSCFIPKSRTKAPYVMHLIPVGDYSGELIDGSVFISGEECSGLLLPPVCLPLLHELKRSFQLTIPDSKEELSILIKEIVVDVLEVAGDLEVSWSGNGVHIRMDGFRLYRGCRQVSEESPACCTLSPCVICSLFATCISEGMERPVQVDRCVPEKSTGMVDIIYTVLS